MGKIIKNDNQIKDIQSRLAKLERRLKNIKGSDIAGIVNIYKDNKNFLFGQAFVMEKDKNLHKKIAKNYKEIENAVKLIRKTQYDIRTLKLRLGLN